MRDVYGKLIRDRIPELMDADGLRYEVAELDGTGFHPGRTRAAVVC